MDDRLLGHCSDLAKNGMLVQNYLTNVRRLHTLLNLVGLSFQLGKHTRLAVSRGRHHWLPTLTDLDASGGVASDLVPTLFIAAQLNGSSVWVSEVDKVSGAMFEQKNTADRPSSGCRSARWCRNSASRCLVAKSG